MHRTSHSRLLNVNREVGLLGCLIWVVDAREALDLATSGLGVNAPLVGLLRVLEARGHVHEVEVAELLDELASLLARVLERSDWSSNDGSAGAGQLRGNKGDAADVGLTVLAGEAELGRKLVADGLSEKKRDGATSLLVESNLQGAGDGVLSAVLVTGQEDSETLRGTWWVGLAEHADDLWVGEPLWNFTASAETVAELSSGDVEGANAGWDLILWLVLVRVWEVGHHLERHNLDTELVLVLLNRVLGVVWAVELLALAVLSWAGVITSDNEVGRTEVLANDRVPDSLTRTTHAHGKREETEDGHTVRVAGKECLVDTDTGEMVNVSWLGKTDDWMNEDIGLARTSSANRQLTMSAVHWVAGLESNDAGPAQFVEVKAELSRSVFKVSVLVHSKSPGGLLTAESNVIVVLESVYSIELSTNVELASGLVEVLDSWVLDITAEDLLGLLRPVYLLDQANLQVAESLLVWPVDVVNGQNGEVTVVTEIAESDAGSCLDAEFLDRLLGEIEGDWHTEEVAICQAVVRNDAVAWSVPNPQLSHLLRFGVPIVILLVEETYAIGLVDGTLHPHSDQCRSRTAHLLPKCASSSIIACGFQHTLQRRETTAEDQFQIAQLSLGQNDCWESLGLRSELVVAGRIAGEEVLEDTTVRSVGHCERICGMVGEGEVCRGVE